MSRARRRSRGGRANANWPSAIAATLLLGGIALSGMCCAEPSGEVPRLYAAASLTPVVDALLAARSAEPGESAARPAVATVLGATSLIARQLEEGAPAGCFLGADAAWADELAVSGLIEPGTRVDLLANRLVVIVPADSVRSLTRLADLADATTSRLALADPDSVPAGRYASAALRHAGVWTELQPRVVACADVRSATALVAAGEADAGIVYATDARAAGVRVIHQVAAEAHPRIRYPLLLVKGSPPAARALWEWLQSDVAADVFRNAGFIRLGD